MVLEDDKRATTNVQNGLVFFFLFYLILSRKGLILRESPGGKGRSVKRLVARAIRNALIRANRFARESFAIDTPICIARQADSPESLRFPIRANHLIRTNRANRFTRT